jgi:uncharacterized protein
MARRLRKSVIGGLLVAALSASPASAQPPAESPSSSEVEAPGPLGPLRGTLLTPAGDSSAVMIMIPGSGATDRDGNGPGGAGSAAMRLVAEGLAARGIATIRIDKRGLFGSGRAVVDANRVSIGDYAADVSQWVGVALERTGRPCAWLLGHSEGGLVALAAGQRPEDICGLVLVASAGRPLGAVLREQLRSNPANAPLLDEALPAIDSLEQGRGVDTSNMNPALMPLFAPPVQAYLIDLMSYDPSRLAAATRLPLLIVQGLRDLQVREADARALAAARPDARLVMVTEANHVLKAVPDGDRAANVAAYTDPSLPIAPGVVEAIADFVVQSGPSGRAGE